MILWTFPERFVSSMSALNAVMESFVSSITESTDITTPDDPFTGPIKSIAPWNYTFLACLMFIVTSLSLTENFTVMLVTFKYKQLRKPLNYIIVNLSVADFLVSLTGGVISFLTNARGYFFLGAWACVLEGFAVTFFGELLHNYTKTCNIYSFKLNSAYFMLLIQFIAFIHWNRFT